MNLRPTPIPHLEVRKTGPRKDPFTMITGVVPLPCWNGYFLKEGHSHAARDIVITNGAIKLYVDGRITPDGTIQTVPEQDAAYFYLVEHQEAIQQALLQELRLSLPRLLEEDYASWDREDGGFPQLSDLTSSFDWKRYIGPGSIQIGEDVKDGVAYLHWQFQCRWDPEHGIQAITHQDRVIDLSPDTDVFKINRDNGTYEEIEAAYKDKVWVVPKKKKKWWQFW